MPDATYDVIVVGAGLAGLACAARLRHHGVARVCVLDQGEGVGAAWRGHYRRLQMNSPFHDLPDDGGLRARWGVFLSRAELVSYLQAYADHHELAARLRFRERVRSIQGGAGGWRIVTATGAYQARFVVVATAINRVPRRPSFVGGDRYTGQLLHSSEYWDAEPFRGRRVLVIGSGNSAADLALDLVTGDARAVALWVRAPRHVLDREAFARAAVMARRVGVAFTPRSLADAHPFTRTHPQWSQRLRQQDEFLHAFAVDLSAYGVRTPDVGAASELALRGREPWYDAGTAREIRAGKIDVIDGTREAIEALGADGVQFTGGARPFDAIVLATGFTPQLETLLDDAARLLDWDDRHRCLMPRTDGRCRSAVEPSLFFPGFDETPYGGMSLGLWGAEAADTIASELK
jgi:indole-3-pyruvate monooxygenase